MNWVVAPDGKQYEWINSKYGWGLGFFTLNGKQYSWQKPIDKPVVDAKNQSMSIVYKAGDIQIRVMRRLVGGELFEEYTFTNKGKTAAHLIDWGIYTPVRDKK